MREFADRAATLFLCVSFEPLLQALSMELVATKEFHYHGLFDLAVFGIRHPLNTKWAQAQIAPSVLKDVVNSADFLSAHSPMVAVPPMHKRIIDTAKGKTYPSKTQDGSKSRQEDPCWLHLEILEAKRWIARWALEVHLDLSDCICHHIIGQVLSHVVHWNQRTIVRDCNERSVIT